MPKVVYDGMELDMPRRTWMQACYRSGDLLALFPTVAQAEKYISQNSSLRMVEDFGYKFRVVPVDVTLYLEKQDE